MIEQEKSGKFLPAFFVDVVDMGEEFPAEELPRHLTLFPPVEAPYTPDMSAELKYQFNPNIPFEVAVGKDALYGKYEEIPVQEIQESTDLRRIHDRLVASLGHLLHDDTFIQPYSPHMTIVGERLPQDATLPIGGFAVVEKSGSTWTVVDKVGFRKDL